VEFKIKVSQIIELEKLLRKNVSINFDGLIKKNYKRMFLMLWIQVDILVNEMKKLRYEKMEILRCSIKKN
jgi:hypothetical protein